MRSCMSRRVPAKRQACDFSRGYVTPYERVDASRPVELRFFGRFFFPLPYSVSISDDEYTEHGDLGNVGLTDKIDNNPEGV